ncbi:MAG: hypothetical protein ACI4SO_01535 [Muribaculaceae bacterium]
MMIPQPSLAEARCKNIVDKHRVRSRRDLNPAIGSSLCRQRAPALCADAH